MREDELKEESSELKKERGTVILAHNYRHPRPKR